MGEFTDVDIIQCPISAPVGEDFVVSVRTSNLIAVEIPILTRAWINGELVIDDWQYYPIGTAVTYTSPLFTMPNRQVEVITQSYAWDPYASEWYLDDTDSTVVQPSAEVTGEIFLPKVEIDGTAQDWGLNAPFDHRYRVIAYAKYQAPGPKHTKMALTIYSSDGSVYSCEDTEIWPYTSPGNIITFSLPTPAESLLGWKTNASGLWSAELKYILIEAGETVLATYSEHLFTVLGGAGISDLAITSYGKI